MTQRELFQQIHEGTSLNEIQEYVKKVIEARGFGDQSAQTGLLLLLEETGELAKAIRKSSAGMSIDENKLHHYDTVESEAADVFIVLLSICNTLGIRLFDALMDKERTNMQRSWSINKS